MSNRIVNEAAKEAAKLGAEKIASQALNSNPDVVMAKAGIQATKTAGKILKRPLLRLIKKLLFICIAAGAALWLVCELTNMNVTELYNFLKDNFISFTGRMQ